MVDFIARGYEQRTWVYLTVHILPTLLLLFFSIDTAVTRGSLPYLGLSVFLLGILGLQIRRWKQHGEI